MPLLTLFEQVFTLMIIIFVGYIAAKKGMLSKEIQAGLSNILLTFAIPATIIISGNLTYSDKVIPNMIQVWLISMISYLFFIFLSLLSVKIFKIEKDKERGFISSVVFANVAFIGYPFAQALYGKEGVLYTSIALLVYSTFMWTYGVYLFSGSKKIDFLKFVNPCTISTIIMIIIFACQIKLPYIIQTSFEVLSGITIPVSMILIGAAISEINIKTIFNDRSSIIASFLRLLMLPILLLFALKAFEINETVLTLCITLSALPSGSLNIILAQKYNCNPVFVSKATFVSMILFLLTMPLVIFLVYRF